MDKQRLSLYFFFTLLLFQVKHPLLANPEEESSSSSGSSAMPRSSGSSSSVMNASNGYEDVAQKRSASASDHSPEPADAGRDDGQAVAVATPEVLAESAPDDALSSGSQVEVESAKQIEEKASSEQSGYHWTLTFRSRSEPAATTTTTTTPTATYGPSSLLKDAMGVLKGVLFSAAAEEETTSPADGKAQADPIDHTSEKSSDENGSEQEGVLPMPYAKGAVRQKQTKWGPVWTSQELEEERKQRKAKEQRELRESGKGEYEGESGAATVTLSPSEVEWIRKQGKSADSKKELLTSLNPSQVGILPAESQANASIRKHQEDYEDYQQLAANMGGDGEYSSEEEGEFYADPLGLTEDELHGPTWVEWVTAWYFTTPERREDLSAIQESAALIKAYWKNRRDAGGMSSGEESPFWEWAGNPATQGSELLRMNPEVWEKIMKIMEAQGKATRAYLLQHFPVQASPEEPTHTSGTSENEEKDGYVMMERGDVQFTGEGWTDNRPIVLNKTWLELFFGVWDSERARQLNASAFQLELRAAQKHNTDQSIFLLDKSNPAEVEIPPLLLKHPAMKKVIENAQWEQALARLELVRRKRRSEVNEEDRSENDDSKVDLTPQPRVDRVIMVTTLVEEQPDLVIGSRRTRPAYTEKDHESYQGAIDMFVAANKKNVIDLGSEVCEWFVFCGEEQLSRPTFQKATEAFRELVVMYLKTKLPPRDWNHDVFLWFHHKGEEKEFNGEIMTNERFRSLVLQGLELEAEES